MGTGSVADTIPIKSGTSPVSTPIKKRTMRPSRRATRTAITPETILMTVFAPEDLAGRGRTKAFGVRGSLIMANCLTRESVRSDQKLYLLGTGNSFGDLATIWLRQSIYRERFKRELLPGQSYLVTVRIDSYANH